MCATQINVMPYCIDCSCNKINWDPAQSRGRDFTQFGNRFAQADVVNSCRGGRTIQMYRSYGAEYRMLRPVCLEAWTKWIFEQKRITFVRGQFEIHIRNGSYWLGLQFGRGMFLMIELTVFQIWCWKQRLAAYSTTTTYLKQWQPSLLAHIPTTRRQRVETFISPC